MSFYSTAVKLTVSLITLIFLYCNIFLGQSGQPIEEDACYLFNFRTITWTKKELKGVDLGPGPLYGHSGTLGLSEIGVEACLTLILAVFPGGSRLLFVMFGVNRDGQVSNRISLLDTNTYEWVDKYSSPYPGGNDTVITGGKNPDTTSPTDANGPSEGSSKGVIAGAVVGCVAGVVSKTRFHSSQ